jgi:hypothetical protein
VAAVFLVLVIILAGVAWPSWFSGAGDASPTCNEVDDILAEIHTTDAPAPTASPADALPWEGSNHVMDEAMLPVVGPEWVLTANFSEDTYLASLNHGSPSRDRAWREALTDHRFNRGWTRIWLFGSGHARTDNVRETMLEFASPQDARAFHVWASDFTCNDALTVFSISGLPGAVGARFRFPDRMIEQVAFLVGNRRITIMLGSVTGSPDRRQLLQLVDDARDFAAWAPKPCSETRELLEEAISRNARPPAEAGQVRTKDLLNLLPTRGGGDLDITDFGVDRHATAPEIEGMPNAWRQWASGARVVLAEVIQFPDRDAVIGWMRTSALHTCAQLSTSAVHLRLEAPGSIEFFQQDAERAGYQDYFVRGSRGYWLFSFGPNAEFPPSTWTTFLRRAAAAAR